LNLKTDVLVEDMLQLVECCDVSWLKTVVES